MCGGIKMANFCSKCGAGLEENAKFCVKCGKPVGNEESIVQPESVLSENQQQTATLEIVRGWRFFNLKLEFAIILDDVEIGRLKNDSRQTFQIPAGGHTLSARAIDVARGFGKNLTGFSLPFSFDIKDGEYLRLECNYVFGKLASWTLWPLVLYLIKGGTIIEFATQQSRSASSSSSMKWIAAAIVLLLVGGWYLVQDEEKTSKTEKMPIGAQTTVATPKPPETNSKPATPPATSKPQPAPTNSDSTVSQYPATPEQILQAFHQNITNKDYRKAYLFLSKDFRDSAPYDDWEAGFRTTVSSTVSNVKVESQSGSQAVLTYTLKAVDNPGGTQYFQGTAIYVWTKAGWKIDDITNKPM